MEETPRPPSAASWLLLQLADSAFPIGGFAHSGGLEVAAQVGEIRGGPELRSFCEQALWQVGFGALPFARAAHLAPDDVGVHDARVGAFLSNHVANRASKTQGRALLATLARVFPRPAIVRLDEAARAATIHGHHAPAYGAAMAALEIEWDDAARLLLHQSLRATTSAAVRLGLVGPHEAQRLQHELGSLAGHVFETCARLGVDEAAQPAPLLDLFGSMHDRLYARLFQS